MVAALGLGAVIAPHVAGAQEHPPGHGGEGDGILPPGDWSPAQRERLLGLVEAVQTDLPALFGDVTELPDSYTDFGATVGGYWHFVDWTSFDDGHILDSEHPEALVYKGTFYNSETGENDLEVVSAMYMMPMAYDMTNLPPDLAWLPGLHSHENLCVNETTKMFAGFPPCGAGSRVFDRPLMMHAWLEDPGCGHHFGGIDIDGLHCDVHGHPGGPGGSTTTTTEHQHPTTTEPGHEHPTTTEPGHEHPTTSTSTPGHNHHDPPPATPIHRHPTDAG